MSKLHTKQCGAQDVRFEEPTLPSSDQTLSTNTLRALNELGDVLRRVHSRMVSEGYVIVDGRIQKM